MHIRPLLMRFSLSALQAIMQPCIVLLQSLRYSIKMPLPGSTAWKILALLCFLLLSSCKPGECIPAGSFVDVISSKNVVHANAAATSEPHGMGYYQSYSGVGTSDTPVTFGKWVDSGITVSTSDHIEISAQGTIFLSPPTTTNFLVSSTATEWLDTGVTIVNGDHFSLMTKSPTISINGCGYGTSKTCTTVQDCVNVWDYEDDNGKSCLSGGTGLVSYVGTPADNLFPDQTYNTASSFEGNRGFSLWNNANGRLYLALKDRFDTYRKWVSCSTDGFISDGGCVYDPTSPNFNKKRVFIPYRNDNKGGYAVTLLRTPVSVIKRDGEALDVLVVDTARAFPTSRSDGQLISLTNGSFSGTAPRKGKIWLRVHDNNDIIERGYPDNVGQYQVIINKTIIKNQAFSGLVNSVTGPIERLLQGVSETIYKGIVGDTAFKRIVYTCLILYVLLYAIFFTLGLIKDKHTELVMRTFKIGVMLALISDTSWEFFNTHLFKLFSDGSRFLLSISTGTDGTSSNIFSFLDTTVGLFFVSTTWKKLGALLLAFPLGIIYAGIILRSFIIYLMAIIEAILCYLTSFIAISVMIILAPFFLVGTLFSTTRPLFDAWVSHLLNFTLQPVLLFTSLMFFNQFMVIAFYKALFFKVCYQCVLDPVIPLHGEVLGIPDLPLGCLMYYWLPDGFTYSHLWSPPDMFASVMMCLIISDATWKFVECIPDITGMLTETGLTDRIPLSSNAVMERMASLPHTAKEVGKIAFGVDDKSIKRRETAKAAQKEKERKGVTGT